MLRGLLFLLIPTLSLAQLENIPSWKLIESSAGDGRTDATAATLRAKGRHFIRSVQYVRPEPATTAAELTALNPQLPKLLPGFARLMATAELSSRYSELYDLKLKTLRRGESLTPHNYFDCQTVLRLQDPDTNRKVLLLQADMDVVTDGSDPVRAPQLADYDLARTSDWFLPETAYSWSRPGSAAPNPFLDYYPDALAKLEKLRAQLAAEAKADRGVVWRELLKSCDDQIYRIKARGLGRGTKQNLRARRFLLSDRDPFVVLPVPWINKSAAWSPRTGDYAAVVCGGRIYPAILGDAGPSFKVGEASLRLARELNPKANGRTRAVSDLTVTYLFFPRSGPIKGEPNPAAWRQQVLKLLNDIGGLSNPEVLHDWNPDP
jgi:hypothetical protein